MGVLSSSQALANIGRLEIFNCLSNDDISCNFFGNILVWYFRKGTFPWQWHSNMLVFQILFLIIFITLLQQLFFHQFGLCFVSLVAFWSFSNSKLRCYEALRKYMYSQTFFLNGHLSATATSLQQPHLFIPADSSYIHSYFNLTRRIWS